MTIFFLTGWLGCPECLFNLGSAVSDFSKNLVQLVWLEHPHPTPNLSPGIPRFLWFCPW